MSKRSGVLKFSGPDILINLVLVVISIIFALFLSEVAVRLMGMHPMYVSPERDRFWKYDSLLGWVHQPGQEGVFETQQFRTSVHINQKGLRDDEYSYERSKGVQRILVIGDSFAWGYGVESNQRFSELLEASLNVEVINAGVSGYSTDQELLWFQNEGIKYTPDLVILVLTGNDIGDNSRKIVSTIYYKPMFVLEGGQLILENYPVPKTSLEGKTIYYLSQRSSLFYFFVQKYFDLISIYRNSIAESDVSKHSSSVDGSESGPFQLTIALLQEIQMLAKTNGARFLIVSTDRWWNAPSEEGYKDFITALGSEGFLVLDVESMPGFDPSKMIIPEDGHWNSAGHEFVAKKIADFIEENRLLVNASVQNEKNYTH